MQYEEFEGIKEWWNNRTENENAWSVPVEDLLKYDTTNTGLFPNKIVSVNLDRKNPNKKTENEYIEPTLAIAQIL